MEHYAAKRGEVHRRRSPPQTAANGGLEHRMRKLRRYSALLLVQNRGVVNGKSRGMRDCLRSLHLINARNAKEALKKAKRIGKGSEFVWKAFHDIGGMHPCYDAHWEFVGVEQLIHLDSAFAENEVWCQVVRKWNPMERKSELIPAEADLSAIKEEKDRKAPTTRRRILASRRRAARS